jgi:hypothetical protein
MVSSLREMNMQLMVSVWSKFDEQTEFYKTMEKNGQMLGRWVGGSVCVAMGLILLSSRC